MKFAKRNISKISTIKRPSGSFFTHAAYIWLFLVIVGCAFADFLAPRDVDEMNLAKFLSGPSKDHLLGTDSLGRDILSRMMFGGRSTLLAISLAVIIYVVLGTVLGLLAGYLSGWTDRFIVAFNSATLAMPKLIILFVVLAVFRNNVYLAMSVFGLLSSPILGMIVRSSAMGTRNELFVDAAKVSGLSPLHIIRQHILPRTLSLIIVQATVFGATAIVVESALNFLGFGTQQPVPSWGNMVSEATGNISLNAWMLYPTGGIIALTALSLGLIGDSLRDRVAGKWTAPKITLERISVKGKEPAKRFSDGNSLLVVNCLSVGYKTSSGTKTVVKNVSFEVKRGETLGIVGESGSGKTTVAFGILGVMGDIAEISSGQVIYDNTNLLNLTLNQMDEYRGTRIAYVAQEPMVALDPNFKIGKLLTEAIVRNTELTRAHARKRAIELLDLVEIRDSELIMDRYPHQLSGGMAQRVAIALALAGEPELLVADEPTTALDVTVQAGILGLLRNLREKTGLAIILITHDWGVVADVCDRVAVMYKGEIVEQNTAENIYNDPQHPYTQALLKSNPHGAKAGQELPVIQGDFQTPSMESSSRTSGGK